MAQALYDSVKITLENCIKKILRYEDETRKLKNEKKVEFKDELVAAYNSYADFLGKNISNFNERSLANVESSSNNFKLRLLRALQVLGYSVELPVKFALIELSDVKTLNEFENLDNTQIFVSSSKQCTSAQASVSDLNKTLSDYDDLKQTDNDNDDVLSDRNSDTENEHDSTIKKSGVEDSDKLVEEISAVTVLQSSVGTNLNGKLHSEQSVTLSRHTENPDLVMAQSVEDFLKIASGVINYKFNGDPMKLRSFLNDVNIVKNATHEANTNLCVSFILGRLEGRALDGVPEDVKTVDEIVNKLKAKIKAEPSEVVESKILNLKVRRGDFNKFSEEAEKLCESFRRSLIVEGIPSNIAEKWSIKRAVKLCRKTARDESVKN